MERGDHQLALQCANLGDQRIGMSAVEFRCRVIEQEGRRMAARASGKLLLAYSSEQLRTDFLSGHRLNPRTKNTITTLPRLYEEFEQIKAVGYATDIEEFSQGLCCLAVGIGGGTQPFALTMSAPSDRFEQMFQTYLRVMKSIANEFS